MAAAEARLGERLLGKPAGVGQGRRAAWTLVLWWAIMAIGLALAMLGPTLEELRRQLGLSTAAASTLFTGRALGYLFGAVWCGDLLHRYDRPAVIFACPLFVAAMGALWTPSVSSYALGLLIFVSQGFSMAMLDTGGNLLMLDLWRGSLYQNGFEHAFHFLFGLGAAVAPLVVRQLLLAGLPGVQAWTAVGAAMLPSCLGLLALSFGPQPRPKEEADDAASTACAVHATRAVNLTGAFLFVYVGIEVAFGGYIDIFSVLHLSASGVEGAALTSVYWSALCAGRLVASLATPFVHHARYLAGHLLLAAASMLGLLLGTLRPEALRPGSPAWSWDVVGPTALFGFALAPLFPGALLLAEEVRGCPLRAREAGRIIGCAAAGEMLVPTAVGVLFAAAPGSFPWALLAAVAVAAGVFLAGSGGLLRAARQQGK